MSSKMNEETICLLCKTVGKMFKYIDAEHTKCSNVSFRTILENTLSRKVKFEKGLCVCVDCVNLLNELDFAEITYKTIKQTVLNYYGYEDFTNNNTSNAYSQTDDSEKIKLIDDASKPFNIKEEFLCEKFEIEYLDADNINNYKCNDCRDSFSSKKTLALHIKKYHAVQFRENKVDLTETSLWDHEEKELEMPSDDINDYIKIDDYKPTRKQNMQRAHYKCGVCSKTWKFKKNLERHIVTHHIDQQPFICEICGQIYKRINDLKIHIGRHNGVYPYTCLYCEKSFVKRAALRNHLPIHTGETRFQCDLCGKRFIHHSSLRVHKLLHSGYKSYKCPQCELALFSKSHFDRHMRVHTGEKKYKCSFCNKAFAERYNLVSHQKIHLSPPEGVMKT